MANLFEASSINAKGQWVGEDSSGTKWAAMLDYNQAGTDTIYIWKNIDTSQTVSSNSETDADIFGAAGAAADEIGFVLDSADVLHVVVSNQDPDEAGDAVAYNTYDLGTETWGTWEAVLTAYDNGVPTFGDVAIDIDQNDVPHVLFQNNPKVKGTAYSNIFYSNRIGGSWSTPVSITDGGEVNYRTPQLLVIDNNAAEASFSDDTNGTHESNSRSGGSWGTQTEVRNADVWLPDTNRGMTRTTGGTLYRYSTLRSPGPYDIYEEASDTGVNAEGFYLWSAYLDKATGDRYLFYEDLTNEDIYYAVNDGGGWSVDNEFAQLTLTDGPVVGWQYRNLNNTTTIDLIYETASGWSWDEFSLATGTQFNQSAAGSIASGNLTGALDRQTEKAVAGVWSSAGAIAKEIQSTKAGALTFAGGLAKQAIKSFAGTLTSSGSLDPALIFLQVVSGAISYAGDVKKTAQKSTAGALSSAGNLARQAAKSITGAVTSGGSLARQTIPDTLSGTLTSSGSIARQAQKSLAGIWSGAGSLATEYTAGVIQQAVGGAISFAGDLAKQISPDTLSGAVSFSGTMNATRAFLQAVSGTLSFGGSLAKQAGKSVAGNLLSSGTLNLVKSFTRTVTGALTPAGNLTRQIIRQVDGVLTSAGILSTSQVIKRLVAGQISFSGSISKAASKSFGGALTAAGNIAKQTAHQANGILAPAGDLAKQAAKQVSGVLSSSGIVSASQVISRLLTGQISLSGSVNKATTKSFSGALSLAGLVKRGFFVAVGGTLSFAGNAVGILGSEIARTVLTLKDRSFDLRLRSRTMDLTLRARSFILRLKNKLS